MILKEKERTTIEDLQTQEKSCVEKYGKYAEQAKDPELKSLFQTLQKKEQEHYDSLGQVLSGTVPQCNCNDSDGKNYEPKATYSAMENTDDKLHRYGKVSIRRIQYRCFQLRGQRCEKASCRYSGGGAEPCGNAL